MSRERLIQEMENFCPFNEPEEALKASTEPWFVERIYKKLMEKVERL